MQYSPSCYYYKVVSIVLQEKSFGFISEDLKHDIAFDIVMTLSWVKFEYVKGNYMHITVVKYFSDGCVVQYKNYKYFLNLCHHYSDFDMEAEWNFFATSHGKSAVNGNRCIIKWLTARASFQKPYNNQILSVEAVYLSCSKNTEYILFNFCERDTLNILWDKLAYHYEYGKTVPGTHSYQQLAPVSVDKVDYNKPVKDGNDLAGTFTFKKQ